MDKKGIYLITGIVVTVLFWIFRVEVYEGLYQAPGYSDAMYNTGIYGIVGIISAAMAWRSRHLLLRHQLGALRALVALALYPCHREHSRAHRVLLRELQHFQLRKLLLRRRNGVVRGREHDFHRSFVCGGIIFYPLVELQLPSHSIPTIN